MLGVIWLVMGGGLSMAAPLKAQQILVLGDSVSAGYGLASSQGWVSLLERKLSGKANVINASVSGETSAGGKSRLPALLVKHQPTIVLIELGGNDALRGLALSATQHNLTEMIRAAQATQAKVLLIGMQVPPNYGKAYTAQFQRLFLDVARAEKIPVVPFLLAALAGQRDAFQADGIHPIAAAQPRLLDTVWPQLRPLLDQK